MTDPIIDQENQNSAKNNKVSNGKITVIVQDPQGNTDPIINQKNQNSAENNKVSNGKITVIIQDPQGNEVGQFIAENSKSIAELAAMHGINIPVSCGAGVCGVCLCKIESGNEAVKENAFNEPFMPLQKDEKGNPAEILTCVAGFNSEAFNDGKDHTVILKRTY